MSRVLGLIRGPSGTPFVEGEDFLLPNGQTLQYLTELLAMGQLRMDVPVGGSIANGVAAEANGDYALTDWKPFTTKNAGGQLTGFTDAFSAVLKCQLRYRIRVSNVAINVTPKLWYGTAIDGITNVATISGQTACDDTDDDFGGSVDQYQTVAFTMPSGTKIWKAGFTVAGVPATGYRVYVDALLDIFIDS